MLRLYTACYLVLGLIPAVFAQDVKGVKNDTIRTYAKARAGLINSCRI